MVEKEINYPSIGMNMSHGSDLKPMEYSLLVNGDVQSFQGNFAKITNEPSNLLCTRFKPGYKVIGVTYVPSISTTFFFLVNSTEHKSEIGFILNSYNTDAYDKVTNCSSCNSVIDEGTPLELLEQNSMCNYNTFVNADCLDFNIDFPIQSWAKVDDCSIRIYFNDFRNSMRYIDYKDFQKIAINNCPEILIDELDCDKINVFPYSCYPEVNVVDVVPGGQNTAGVYQFVINYSDARSNKISNYFFVTNTVPLFDLPIINNTITDYPIAKSIKLTITNLNTDFKYFNLVVLKTVNNVTTPYLVDTFDIKSNTFTYLYTGIDRNISQSFSIDEILGKSPIYSSAKGLTQSNGYLFHYNLREDRILNLQPVVSKIPLYWQNVELNDGDYKKPIIASNYVSYLGDETYPFGIAFTKNNTDYTNVFPFVGRVATQYDLLDLCEENSDNPDILSESACSPIKKCLNYQVYNTASEIGNAENHTQATPGTTLVDLEEIVECDSDQILVQSQYVDNANNVHTYTTLRYFEKPNPFPILNNGNEVYPTDYSTVTTEYTESYILNPNNGFICDCVAIGNTYDNLISATPNPVVLNLTPTSSIDILQEEEIIEINIYKTPTGAIIPPPILAAGVYPYTPSPCSNKKDDDGEKSWETWLANKTNTTKPNAEVIPQSTTSQCAIETWGSFMTDGSVSSDSWYQFTCTNQDGVAVVNVGTNKSNFTVTVYDSNNNVLTPVLGSILYYSLFFENLTLGETYYILIQGTEPSPPATPTSAGCKIKSFRVCVTSPNPYQVQKRVKPAIATISTSCTIKYKGEAKNNCIAKNHKYGLFAYTESTETYPCNEEVWEELSGQPIRHFKFPDTTITPFFKNSLLNRGDLNSKLNTIYPKGIMVDVKDIKYALNQAVQKGLITEQEKSQICGYRIYRGNRRGNESIIAKGLVRDVLEYKDNIYNTNTKYLFPNFPYNDLTPNPYVLTRQVKNKSIADSASAYFLRHPYEGLRNNKYVFDAPNLSYNNPGLGNELKFECELNGKSIGLFTDVKNNTQYQYIGAGVISAAIGFASVEAAFEALSVMASATLTLDLTIFGSGSSIPLGLILAIIGENLLAPMRIYSHYAEWYEIIKKFAPFRNYAIGYSSVGRYDDYLLPQFENQRREIANTQYIKPGILTLKTSTGNRIFNNFKNESSVFIEVDKNMFLSPQTQDLSLTEITDCNYKSTIAPISSYYGVMKNSLPDQYGQIDNIEWIDTGYNGRIDWENYTQSSRTDTIFGGDTFITRHTRKIKVPMFMEDRVIPNQLTNVPLLNQDIQLSSLPNIGYPRYFMDYPTSLDYNSSIQSLFGDVAVQTNNKADYNFLCFSSSGKSWKDTGIAAAVLGSVAGVSFGVISLPITVGIISGVVSRNLGDDLYLKGKYVHSFYGILDFLCESDYNEEYRHGENIKEKNFYPNVSNVQDWTQESYVPMDYDNFFLYNRDYSKQNRENPNFVLNNDYKREKEDCKVLHPNRVIYSLQDSDNDDRFDGNLVYLANNYFDFPKSRGKLLLVKGVNSGKVLVLQENGAALYNSYISLATDLATSTVGQNTLFNKSLPTLYLEVELGFGGSQTTAHSTSEFGTFWMDNLRGQVLRYSDTIEDIVSPEENWWFKENLPFKILKDFPNYDITNNYKWLGCTITYDSRFKRVIFTKRDVELRAEYRGLVTYDGEFFYYEDEIFNENSDKFFCNKSWTITYSPILKKFISFMTFTPNFYVPNQNYFSSGINYSLNNKDNELGFWHHLLTTKSYQVFYGKLNPFLFEYSVPTKANTKVLESVEYIAEFQRFQDNLSYATIIGKTYNKALIYNQYQTSGVLLLEVKQKNNLQQVLKYHQQNLDSRTILTENIEQIWKFNNFYNIALQNGHPIMAFKCDNIAYKDINFPAISYKQRNLTDLLRSDYFQLRLINDKYSQYNITHRFNINQINIQ